MARKTLPCRHCVLRLLAGVAWPLWGGRAGWPRLTRCADCTAEPAQADRVPVSRP